MTADPSEVPEPEMRKLLTSHGLRVTQQRLSVVRVLASDRCHFSAETLLERVRKAHQTTCRASIYNSLRSLVEAGLIREVAAKLGGTLYELKRDDHAHLICDHCGEVSDIELDFTVNYESLPTTIEVRSVEAIAHGSCKKCLTLVPKKAQKAKKTKNRQKNQQKILVL